MAGGANTDFKFYRYDPSVAANVVFVVLFAAAALGHVFLLVRRKTWYFIPFVIGCIFEAIGYVGRVLSARETPNWTMGPYIMQTLLILLAPALFAASIYMILARLIRYLGGEEYALVRTTWMTKIFVAGDVMSFLGQSAGGGLMAKAKSDSDQKTGEDIILGGLGIQVIFFGFFIITTIVFHMRMARNPTTRSYAVTTPWKQHLYALYVTSALIMVRSLFRMAEFGLGNDGVLMQSEAYLLGLDGALMFIVCAILLYSHPSRVLVGYKDDVERLPSGDAGYEARRNTTESFQMLSHTTSPGGYKGATPYDSDTTGRVMGSRGYTGKA